MQHILMLAENFFAEDSADKNCAISLLSKFISEGYNVTIFSHTFFKNQSMYEKHDGYDVHFFYEKGQDFIDKHFSHTSNPIFSVLNSILTVLFVRLFSWIQKRVQYKAFKKLHKNDPFDFVVSIYCPELSHEVAHLIAKRTKVKTFLYFLDPHTYNYQCNTNFTSSVPKRMKDERRWAKGISGVIMSAGIPEENERNQFYPYKKVPNLTVTLPNFQLNKISQPTVEKHDKITLRYTGKFYENIRNPEQLIRLVSKLDPDKYSVEFYGQCCAYLKEHYSTLPPCVHLMGVVDVDQCRALTASADILINVGNTTPNQVPSKVFEYIGSGKPILNLSLSDRDKGLYYLNKYPKIFQFEKADSIDENALEKFLYDVSPIPYEELYEIYKDYLTESTTSTILHFIESCD